MKKTFLSLASLVLTGSVLLSSCMTAGTSATTTQQPSSTNSTVATGAAIASALLSSSAANNSTAAVANTALSAISNGSLISGVIGLLTGTTSTSTSIVGTWVYNEPTVQFESSNFLAQAGGVIAGQKIVSKLSPYYQKFGFSSGSTKMVFNENNTCTITLGGKSVSGTYVYNSSANVLTIKDQFGLLNLNAYVTLSPSQLALTFDSGKLLQITSALSASGASSNNATVNAISSIASSYNGMKTGFMFVRQ